MEIGVAVGWTQRTTICLGFCVHERVARGRREGGEGGEKGGRGHLLRNEND